MKWMVLSTLGLFAAIGATGARAEDDAVVDSKKASATSSAAKEILAKSGAALKKIRLVRYDGQYSATGWVTEWVPNIEGSAILGEPSKYGIDRFHCKVKLTPAKSKEAVELTAGSDGDNFFLTDPNTKTVYVDMDVAVLGTHSHDIQRILMRSFVAKDPFAEDLKAEKVELQETVEVDGEPCQKVRIVRSETREVVWFISKKDWLPRRVDRFYKNAEGELASTQLVLSNVAAESTFTPAPFKLTVPEGFTKTDEFAP